MRALVLITLLSFGICFGQENPWALKGENPWKAYPQQATEMPQETDSTSAAKEEKDSISLQARPMEENLSETEIYFRAENRAKEVYKSGGDFAFGFVTGICFNVLGVFPDVIYIAPNFKKEKRAIEKVVSEVPNETCDKEKLRKKVKNKVKSKKGLSTIAGTLTGALTQISIGIVIIII